MFGFKLPVTVVHLGVWYLGWEKLVPKEDIWLFFLENSIFKVKGVIFPLLIFAIFQYNFPDSWDVHGMPHIILGYFFPNNYDGNKDISFHDPSGPKGQFFIL